MSFTSVVLCTQTLHQKCLHTRACYKKPPLGNDNGYKFDLKDIGLQF